MSFLNALQIRMMRLQQVACEITVDYVEELAGKKGAESEGGALSGIFDFVVDLGAGVYNTSMTAAIYIALCVCIFTGIGFMIYGSDPQKTSQNKHGAIWKVVGMIMTFASTAIVILSLTIGQGLFG